MLKLYGCDPSWSKCTVTCALFVYKTIQDTFGRKYIFRTWVLTGRVFSINATAKVQRIVLFSLLLYVLCVHSRPRPSDRKVTLTVLVQLRGLCQ